MSTAYSTLQTQGTCITRSTCDMCDFHATRHDVICMKHACGSRAKIMCVAPSTCICSRCEEHKQDNRKMLVRFIIFDCVDLAARHAYIYTFNNVTGTVL